MITKKRMELLTQLERKIILILNRNSCKNLILLENSTRDSRRGYTIGQFHDHLLFFASSAKYVDINQKVQI